MPTRIEWTEETWNPVTGCAKVSPGCDHCYAERMSKRLAGHCGYPADEPFRVAMHPDRLAQPLRWKKPRRIFVCSMGDLFHLDVPDWYIARIFAVMAVCPQHTFQVLTKRPELMHEWFEWAQEQDEVGEQVDWVLRNLDVSADGWDAVSASPQSQSHYGPTGIYYGRDEWIETDFSWPLPNVWLGVTAEDQQRADERIPKLLQIPAAVRFVSCEPLLGAVDLQCIDDDDDSFIEALDGPDGVDGLHLDWVIAGGETGPRARLMHPDWVHSLRDQCVDAGVPFFFKQWGSWSPEMPDDWLTKRSDGKMPYEVCVVTSGEIPNRTGYPMYCVGKKAAGRLLDGRTWEQFPK